MAEPNGPPPAKPPPKKKKSAAERERDALAELIEVERAMAALEGRIIDNAEHLVTQRQDAEKRRAALEQIILASRAEMARRKRLLPYKIGAALLGLGVLAAIAVPVTSSILAEVRVRDAAIAKTRELIAPLGSRFAASEALLGEKALSVPVVRGKCYAVAAASPAGPAHVRVERTVGTREADGSVGFCACGAEEVRVTLTGPDPVAHIVLSAPAGRVGGADVLGALAGRPGATFAETVDRACAEEAFDEWAGARADDGQPPPADKLSPEEKAMAAQGLSPVLWAPGGTPFVLAKPASSACFVAVARGGTPLSLRQKGGERPIEAKNGALGFCAKETKGLSVWPKEPAEIVLLQASRERIGGLLGLREAAGRGGVSITVWTPPEDLEQDAHAALAASGVALPVSGLERKRGAAVAVAKGAKSMLAESDLGPEVVCRPELTLGASQSLCLEARLGAFAPAQPPEGKAAGPSPLWLALPAKPDRAALERALGLLAFARRMNADGYELTSLVGASFTADGLEVTGRSGDKEIVALVASSVTPFVHTLSLGAPWTLSNPKPTALTPGKPLRLKATPRYGAKAIREFVVFRR